MTQDLNGRRAMMTGLGAAVAGFAVGASTACAQAPEAVTPTRGFEPARHEIDAWMDELEGQHRVFIDSATAAGGGEALLFANNLYNSEESAYSGSASDFAMLICLRHFSTPFAYSDAIWAKYGEVFYGAMQFPDPDTGQAPVINLMNSAAHTTLPNFGNTIDALVARGARFAVCDTATRFFAQQIAASTGDSADAVHDELVAAVIPNARFVSAGVMAVTRSQEYGYSLLYAG